MLYTDYHLNFESMDWVYSSRISHTWGFWYLAARTVRERTSTRTCR